MRLVVGSGFIARLRSARRLFTEVLSIQRRTVRGDDVVGLDDQDLELGDVGHREDADAAPAVGVGLRILGRLDVSAECIVGSVSEAVGRVIGRGGA